MFLHEDFVDTYREDGWRFPIDEEKHRAQMLAMILATDLPKDGDAEAAAARAHARTNAHSFSHDSSDCIALTSLAPKPVRRRCW